MTEVRFLGPDTDAYVASVERHSHEFEEASGIQVRFNIIGNDEYFSNDIHRYLEGDEAADVFMSGPVLLWEHVGADFVEPLDEYLGKAGSAFDPDDFFEPLIRSNRWTGRFGDPLGAGPLLEVPVNCESYNLAYVPEILDKAGVQVPASWDEYFAAAKEVVARTEGEVRGFGQRGVDVWHTIYTGYASQFWSCGGRDFDEQGRCSIASPQGVETTEAFIRALQDAGPVDWLNQRWYELALDFGKGKYGLLVDSDHYVAYFENPEHSDLPGRIGYAAPPAGPGGVTKPNLWTWSVVMNSRSSNKEAAWTFIEWATGKDFLRQSAFEGNMDPTRRSTWDDDRFVDHAQAWGDFYATSRELVEETAEVLVTPATNYVSIARRWTRALRDAFSGDASVLDSLKNAAADIDDIVQR